MIIIDEDYNLVIAEPGAPWNKIKLNDEQIQTLKSWINPEPEPEPEPKSPPGPVYAHLTRSDPKSGFAQHIDCTLSSEDGCTSGLRLSEYDQAFDPTMFDLTPTYEKPYVYEVKALDATYQDTLGLRYDIYHITLVDQPYGLRFTRVLFIGDVQQDDEDYGEEYPCK